MFVVAASEPKSEQVKFPFVSKEGQGTLSVGFFPCSTCVMITFFKPGQRDDDTKVTDVSLLTGLIAWG